MTNFHIKLNEKKITIYNFGPIKPRRDSKIDSDGW